MSKKIQQVDRGGLDKIMEAINSVVANVPTTIEPVSANPVIRSSAIITVASLKAAAVSGTLSLPPGPAGLLTIIPDLLAIWRIQQQMVVDIAGAFGKQAVLSQEQMLYCLFRHAAGQAVRDLVARVGERVLVRKASLKVLKQATEKIGIRVTQRVIGRAISRWLPVVGAVALGAYAFYDTHQVGKTAADLFGSNVELDTGVARGALGDGG